ncbi:hypothetical protein [Bacillus thuringiensis]|uniref:hypothetical protein n=1 Tax=Bacillus thuringiensis TaxID=1428 RepID=UPI0021D69E08|nr:hypothetical protein [Bacillus thuringiensis]MCU7667547.1 hypothetical protein [Bacillus thuringiensis]
MKITNQSNLKAEKLNILVGCTSLEVVVVNLLDGTYLIADGNGSDSEYPVVTVSDLEKQTVKSALEESLFAGNIAHGDFTSEDVDVIADNISKLNL